MINRNIKIYTLVLYVIIGFVFLITITNVITFNNDQKIDHSYFIHLGLNSTIKDVAISRKTEIKISGVNGWIRVGGCKLELSKNQGDPKEYFLIGDSIIKERNSNHFLIIRNKEIFSWYIE